MFENKEKTSLEKLGEFGLIDHLTSEIEIVNSSTHTGVGDDAAVINNMNTLTLVSTDLLIENVHFDLAYTPLRHLGYKAVVVNLSDICAMNALPKQITVSIGISSKFTLEAVEELYAGIYAACKTYKVDLVGGDTSSSNKGLIISVTAIGECAEGKLSKRSGAKEGDLLCVTGDLGGAYAGLQILEREKRVYVEHPDMQPDLTGFDYIIGRQLRPEARIDVIEMLEKQGIVPTSMIDVSDGLSSEIKHICKSSEVGVKLHEDKIPIDPVTYNTALEMKMDPTLFALSGGEDYELLFTIPQKDYDKIKHSPDVSVIGYCVEKHEGAQLITKSGNVHELEAQGWQAV